jgi:integrase
MFQSSSECVVKSRPIIVQTKGSINWAKNKLYQRGSSDWYIRLAHDGSPQRHINLKTPIKEEAARRAVSFYKTLRTEGWESAFKTIGTTQKQEINTVGDYFEAMEKSSLIPSKLKEATYFQYRRKLSTLVARSENIVVKNKSSKKGAKLFQSKVRKVQLKSLTKAKIDSVGNDMIKGLIGEDQNRARRTYNSLLSDAKSLFKKDYIDTLNFKLPSSFFNQSKPLDVFHNLYKSFSCGKTIPELIQEISNGLEKLAEVEKRRRSRRAKLAAVKASVLELACGLRRGEVDRLKWEDIEINDEGIFLSIRHTEDGSLKSQNSARRIKASKKLLEILQKEDENGTDGKYVIWGDGEYKHLQSSQISYRTDLAHKHLIQYLRKNYPGLRNVNKPVHTLRKEACSVIANAQGIDKAAKFGGNTPQTCRLHYADIEVPASHL